MPPALDSDYFVLAHPHPPPQRQVFRQLQALPQVQRSAAVVAHPQAVSVQRHPLGLWFSFCLSMFFISR